MENGIPGSEFAECRWDPIDGRWVILSPKRARRPNAAAPISEPPAQTCPFCPGNENQTPPSRYVDRDPAQEQFPWRVRVVENLFGIVERDASQAERPGPEVPVYSRRLPARGVHEIIIETPIHLKHPADYSDEDMAAVMLAYQSRFLSAWSEPEVAYVVIFKNHGRDAGASLEHPHSQLVALPFVPPLTVRTGPACSLCSMLAAEQGGARQIALRNSILIWSPYASAAPYEAWVAPTAHDSDFLTLDPTALFAVGVMLRDLLRALVRAAGNVAFNVIFHVAPRRAGSLHHPWRIEVIPRTTHLAGFELATGCRVNPLPPEHAAHELRRQFEGMGYA